MYFILKGATFPSTIGTITVTEGSVGSGGTSGDGTVSNYKFKVTSNPTTATITLAATGYSTVTGTGSAEITVASGTKVTYTVSADGYTTKSASVTVAYGQTLPVTLNSTSGGSGGDSNENGGTTTTYTFTINPTPSNATVTLTASGYTQSGNSITVASGTSVSWNVSASGYTGQSGTETVTSSSTKNVTLTANTPTVDGTTTWYIDHRDQADSFTSSVNIAGRGWAHVPGTAAYEAYVGKPVNTIGFFTTLASQDITIGKVAENGGVDDMTTIATVTATNATGTTKGFCTITFPTVTLSDGECLVIFAQDNSAINFYYAGSNSVTDANGIVDANFYGRVPKVYGSGTAWTSYSTKICLGISVGYNADIA